jgi:quercetin dioxygenase-like cupin family protein
LAENVDVQLPAGFLRLMIVDHVTKEPSGAPSTASKMHNTDALDIVYVVDGYAELILEVGTYTVRAGECVITPGVDHAWEPGPSGARFLVWSLGTEPLAGPGQ